MTAYDALGIIGVFIIIGAYLALQMEKTSALDWRYSLANGIGSALVLLSLIYSFNIAAFIVESAWLVISLYGLFRAFKTRKLR